MTLEGAMPINHTKWMDAHVTTALSYSMWADQRDFLACLWHEGEGFYTAGSMPE